VQNFEVMKYMLRLKIVKHLSSKFEVNKGLRQGDIIAVYCSVGILQLEYVNYKYQEPYLTNVVKLWHTLMMWKKVATCKRHIYINGRTNQQDGIRNKWGGGDKIYLSIMKALQLK
jgi:hypothetical protein